MWSAKVEANGRTEVLGIHDTEQSAENACVFHDAYTWGRENNGDKLVWRYATRFTSTAKSETGCEYTVTYHPQ